MTKRWFDETSSESQYEDGDNKGANSTVRVLDDLRDGWNDQQDVRNRSNSGTDTDSPESTPPGVGNDISEDGDDVGEENEHVGEGRSVHRSEIMSSGRLMQASVTFRDRPSTGTTIRKRVVDKVVKWTGGTVVRSSLSELDEAHGNAHPAESVSASVYCQSRR